MHQLNSSILTSKKPITLWTSRLKVVTWTFFFLILADVLINLLFPYPHGSKQPPNFLQLYFEYGRSSEGKIRGMVGPTDETSAPILEPGWLGSDDLFEGLPAIPESGRDLLIATYGGSFNQRVSRAIQDNYGDTITVRAVGAPGGPLNWAFTAYQLDRSQHQADAALLTLISFTAAKQTMGGEFGDFPPPYTRPLYFLENNQIQKVEPEITNISQLREAIYEDPTLWEAQVQQFRQYDPYYRPLLFNQSILDHSGIARMLRRWQGKNIQTHIQQSFYNSDGFKPESEAVQVMKALVEDFAESAREDGIVPIVYLANAQGWGDHLYQVLLPFLEERNIPYVSSHFLVPTDDPRLFLGDGHYIPEKDQELADQIVEVIREQI